MLYYRYRPVNALTIKELIYDELYFSYPDELNDPLDGQIRYELPEDYPKWKRLLDYAWKGSNIDTATIADILTRVSPISIKKIIDSSDFLLSKIEQALDQKLKSLAPFLAQSLQNYIAGYTPTDGCSVSFSKTYENALMWSHYTGKHEGFCLIFRSINGCINQCPSRAKESVKPEDGVSIGIPRNFKLQDIQYGPKKNIDGFTLFPYGVFGRDFSQEERNSYWESINEMHLTKSPCWDYEEESRLYLPSPGACVSKERLLPIDRIFHYNNYQIAGVIYGMRMSEENKKLIREILLRKSKERYLESQHDVFLFNIVSFDASFDDEKHTIAIEPVEIFDCGEAIGKSNPHFPNKFTSWEKGEALHIRSTEKGRGASRVILD
ncbi:TPA: DUF2971 domain-containing protein [Citrobacter werkmanii]